jgi:hypothetical protein
LDPEAIIRGELGPSETLLWSGRPRLGVVFRPMDAYYIPFSAVMIAFSVYWCFGVVAQGDPIGLVVGVPLALLGLYAGLGRFFVDRWLRSRMAYGISSERALIVSDWFSHRVRSHCLETLTDLSLTERATGAGRITFGQGQELAVRHAQSYWLSSGLGTIPMFDLAENARQVYETVRDARRAATKRVS